MKYRNFYVNVLKFGLAVVAHTHDPNTGRLRQEDFHSSSDNLKYIVRPCPRKQANNKEKRNWLFSMTLKPHVCAKMLFSLVKTSVFTNTLKQIPQLSMRD